MGVSQYLGPALVGGLNSPHYLDGRLLTAQDLGGGARGAGPPRDPRPRPVCDLRTPVDRRINWPGCWSLPAQRDSHASS
jgi:hypothetical protein